MTDLVKDSQTQPSENNSLSAKLAHEGSLLASIPSQIGAGIEDRAQEVLQHKALTAIEIGSSFAVAAGLTILSKHPGTFGAVARMAPKIFLGLTAADIGRRFGGPMLDTWQHPGNLQHDKQWLGDNLGSAVIDYPLVAAGGYAGDRLTTGLLENFDSTGILGDWHEKSWGQLAKDHGKLFSKHALNGPIAFGVETASQKLFPDHGVNPTFPHTLTTPSQSNHVELKPDQSASVIAAGGFKLTAGHDTQSFGIKVDKSGPVRLDINMDGPGTDWAKNNDESAVVSVYVDGKYSQDMVLFGGSQSEKYSFAEDDLSAGNHTVTLRYAKEKSTSGASGIDVNSGTAEQYTEKTKMDQWIDEYAPVLYGRDGINNNHTDVPMSMYHYQSTNSDGTVNITYGYFYSNEDGGTGSIPAVEQARWGRMTDINDDLKVTVDPTTGKVIKTQYMGEPDVWKPFNGGFQGTHAIINNTTENDDVVDYGTDSMLFKMEPDYQVPSGGPVEELQRENPLWWKTSSVEIEREGKVDQNGQGDTPNDGTFASVVDWLKQNALGEKPKMGDPRNYLYIQQNLQNASATDPVADEVVLKNGKTFVSDFGYRDVAIGRNGWSQTDVLLPPNTTPAEIAKVEFLSRGTGNASVAKVGHVYMLGQDYSPADVDVPIDTNIISQVDTSAGDFSNKQANSGEGQ